MVLDLSSPLPQRLHVYLTIIQDDRHTLVDVVVAKRLPQDTIRIAAS